MDKFAAIHAFVRVVEARGFAAAAREMGMSRSAVNKLVISLEKDLGVKLLQRSTRKVTPTATGSAFYDRCLRIVADLKEAELAVSQAQREPVGPLRINAPMTFGTMHLGPALADFMVRYPGVQIQLTLDDRFIDPIAEGFDLVLRIAQPSTLPNVVVHELAMVRCLLCASPTYLWHRGVPHSVHDLKEHSCLAYGELANHHEWTLTSTEKEQKVSVAGAMCSNNGEVLRDAALGGLGIVLLPEFIVRESLKEWHLQEILLESHPPSLSLCIIYPTNRHLSNKVQLLTTFLQQRFDTLFEADSYPLGKRAQTNSSISS
ncbi:MAG: LysR family transcriptional regulator [Cyanobacteria bacterium P01_D01_bin.156]